MPAVLSDPLSRLARYQLPHTVAEAETSLVRWQETVTLLVTCHRFVPVPLQGPISTAWAGKQENLLPGPDEPYSAVELACLALIEDFVFPFAREHLELCAAEGERLGTIPLHPFGIDYWTYGFEQYNKGWEMLALLNRNVTPGEVSELDPRVARAFSRATYYTRESWSWPVFEAVCQAAPEPLSFLPVAIKMLDHSTNNLFLDPTDEMPVDDATWTLADMELLAREWKEAQTMLEQGDQLTEWLAATASRLRKVVDLWNLATWTMLM